MRSGFDRTPLLSEGEAVLWEGRPSRLKLFAVGAVVTTIATAAWLMAMGEVANAPGGSECLTVDCPTADRKAGFVAYFAGPVSICIGIFPLLLSVFTRQICSVTSKNILVVSFKLWRKQPILRGVPVKGAAAMLNTAPLVTLGLIVRSPLSNKDLILWAKSRAELKKAQSLIEQLSAGEPRVQSHAQ